jgi:hypothetical protein
MLYNMKHLKTFENHTKYEEAKQSLILPNVSLCEQEHVVYFNPYVDPFNGHAYVDLGLPSGTKWATMNIGATSETDYGLYFQWGDTQGYTADQVGSGEGQKVFSWSTYKWTEDNGETMTKYNETDGKTILDLDDDAARANWGGSWKMPTIEQFQELANSNYVTNEWTTINGVNGQLFTSVSNGNTLFIPESGRAENDKIHMVGSGCDTWSSSLKSSNVKQGLELYFSEIEFMVGGLVSWRYAGYTVRPVVS